MPARGTVIVHMIKIHGGMMRPCFSAQAINLPSFLLTPTDHSSISDPQIPLIRVSEIRKKHQSTLFYSKMDRSGQENTDPSVSRHLLPGRTFPNSES